MRINRFVAQATGLSRRKADELIKSGQVSVNGQSVNLGTEVSAKDKVSLNGKELMAPSLVTVVLNKPVGYVVSRDGQGNPTIYDLLPKELHHLKPVGRLDKDSSGLLLLTNDGKLANELTHPSRQKEKVYEVELNKDLTYEHQTLIESGVTLEDRPSKLKLQGQGKRWTITMYEGRNRQIRRTFAALGYNVEELHRIQFGHFNLGTLKSGQYLKIT